MPIIFECPECGGKGCDKCDDGKWNLNECPRRFLDEPAIETLAFARFARDGSWPVAGGMLNQTEWFTDACRLVWSEQSIIESEAISNG